MADDLHNDIINWLHGQQDWLQAAADRLLNQGELSDDDLNKLTEYLKTDGGQKKTNNRQFTGLGQKQSGDSSLHLLSIGNIEGIENLSPRTPLTFGEGNLSVIYGHNGSGKSGYARILKRICGKPRAEELKPNVFKDPPEKQKCSIEYRTEGEKKSLEWQPQDLPVKELEAVDLFDKNEADFYLNQETGTSYTPPEVALFKDLAKACGKIKEKLEGQQNQLVSKLPKLPQEYTKTEAGKIYNNLNPEHTEEELNKILNWTKEDQNKLNQVSERLKEPDPGKLAKAKQTKKQQLDQVIIEKIKNAFNYYGNEACKQVQQIEETAIEKRRIAREGAKAQTSKARLEGIGTDTWNALWEAARAYSKEVAYPKQDFPVTEEGARCVLCHQKLDSDPEAQAQERLKDFESYVQGQLETDAKEAEQKRKETLDKLPVIPDENELKTSCEAAGLDEEWLTGLQEFWNQANKVLDELKQKDNAEVIQGVPYPKEILQKLEQKSEQLKTEIEQHQSDAKEFNREQVEKEQLALKARKWTSQQKDAIQEEIHRLKQNKQYESWKGLVNPRSISIKADKISEQVITDAYIGRFNEELKVLGADHLKVELIKTRTEKGAAKHQIRLCNVQTGNPEVSILSDGERRIVALAAFLADVTGRPETSPFIFDDPISSLDHDFEWEVAMRLADLATERQVIVLTHRLSLYGVLEDAEKKVREKEGRKKYIVQHCIESLNGSAGHPANEQVWAQKTKTGNENLIERLNKAKKDFENGGESEVFKERVKSICTDFRKLLERTVENDLLNEVVQRHRRSVMTDKKLSQLTQIEKDDTDLLDHLMTKYSKFEHSQSQEIPVDLPEEQELREDLEELNEWRKKFKDRKPS